ncbi:MAG: DUF933 domain-containing protein [Thermodesulfobacteriota bacterium]
MQLGILGLAGAGRATLFSALAASPYEPEKRSEAKMGMVNVPDERVDFLSGLYKPKKTTYARVQYLLPGVPVNLEPAKQTEAVLNAIKPCDALIHVLRNFPDPGGEAPAPATDFSRMESELIFADLFAVERKLERAALDAKRGKKPDEEEMALLERCKALLSADTPLRRDPELAAAKKLRGYTFVSAKPEMVVANNDEGDPDLPDLSALPEQDPRLAVRGKLEAEIAQMSLEEAADFLAEYQVTDTARDRVLRKSYELLGLISFFTVGEDEVRAWTIRRGDSALAAAEAIHTDLARGFIRAEVLAYDDLVAAGSFNEAKKRGQVRLEGKTYEVKDGDIVHIRFNV